MTLRQKRRQVVTYLVLPHNSIGYGVSKASNTIVVVGTPYELPFHETFASGFSRYPLWGIVGDLTKIFVDNMGIRDVYENDLSAGISCRKRFKLGEPNTITATVENVGTKVAMGYQVEFLRSGEVIRTVEGEALPSDVSKTYSITEIPGLGSETVCDYQVVVVYAADQNQENNTSKAVTVTNLLPKYPVATGLAGWSTKEGNVALDWNAPDLNVERDLEPVTDDFEAYDPFIIDEIGDWTVVDVNGAAGTFGLLGMDYPYREAAKAFQVFSLKALGITPGEDETSWIAHSGDQMLTAFADKDRKNDDWLISPELSGKAQTITFFARGTTYLYPYEAYEVLVSSTGTNLPDFRKIEGGQVEEIWTEVSVDLPEGSSLVAIPVESGVYLVKAGTKVGKVIVR